MDRFTAGGAPVAAISIGSGLDTAPLHFIWAHGWGQDHRAFLPLAQALSQAGAHTLVDFPGFGGSPRPAADWGTAEYADAFAEWLAGLPRRRRIWIGHSFGCRVGLQLASRHPGAVDGLFLIAAAGLPRTRSALEQLKIKSKVTAFKMLKHLSRIGLDTTRWTDRFGSADYRNAGAMRPIFVKVVREDLSEPARRIECPVQLVYGERDQETPPEIGERLVKLIPHASLTVLPRFDHYTILTAGAHQVQHQLQGFASRINS